MKVHLYHYCSLPTFEAIINSSCLRLSDISKSNDSKELLYAIPIIKDSLYKAFDAEKTKEFLNNVDRSLFNRTCNEWIESRLCNSDIVCYAACFSQRDDLLSQWRGYADDASGISIGFDLDCLNNHKFIGIELGKILYDKRKQKGNARKIADDIIKDLRNVAKIASASEEDIINSFESRIEDYLRIMATYKSGFFKEEQEWRLYGYSTMIDIGEECKFHGTDGKKYIDIPISSIMIAPRGVDIVLGPKCKAREKDIKSYLKSKDIEANVRKSRGSFI